MKKAIRASVRRFELGLFVGLLALMTAGCGYHFAAEGSGLPPQAKTIYVATFGNHTRFTGVNEEFMRYLKDEIANRKRLALVDSPDGADLVLSGDILYKFATPDISNTVGEPISYQDSLSTSAVLTDGHTHAVIWISRGLSVTAEAPSVASAVLTTSPYFLQQNLRSQDIAKLPDLQTAKTQGDAAQTQMMQELAQNLYASMAEGF